MEHGQYEHRLERGVAKRVTKESHAAFTAPLVEFTSLISNTGPDHINYRLFASRQRHLIAGVAAEYVFVVARWTARVDRGLRCSFNGC